MGSLDIVVLVANIDQYMSQDKIDSDIKELAAKAVDLGADFVSGAEIMSPESYRAWEKAFEAAGYKVYGNGPRPKENPIAVKDRFKVGGHNVRLLSKGVAKLTPNRYLTWVATPSPSVGLFVGATHLVSEFQKPTASRKAERKQLYKAERKIIRKRLYKAVKNGKFAIILGDMNAPAKKIDWRQALHRLTMKQVDLVPYKGSPMQKMMVAAAVFNPRVHSVEVLQHGNVGTSKLHTDHPFRWAKVRITQK